MDIDYESHDSIELINSKIDSVKNVIHDNVTSILERQEKLEVLVDKTEDFKEKSYTFHWKSKNIKKKMICKKVKHYLVGTFLILSLIWFLSVLICGIDYTSCEKKKKKH